MTHYSVHTLHLSWHTAYMENFTIYVHVTSLFCRCCLLWLCCEHTPLHREVGCRTHSWMKRSDDLTAPDRAQYSLHKTLVHPQSTATAGSAHHHSPPTGIKHFKVETPEGMRNQNDCHLGGCFQVSPTVQSWVFKRVRETHILFIKSRTLYLGKNVCWFLSVKDKEEVNF
jgi:hypothetical protein